MSLPVGGANPSVGGLHPPQLCPEGKAADLNLDGDPKGSQPSKVCRVGGGDGGERSPIPSQEPSQSCDTETGTSSSAIPQRQVAPLCTDVSTLPSPKGGGHREVFSEGILMVERQTSTSLLSPGAKGKARLCDACTPSTPPLQESCAADDPPAPSPSVREGGDPKSYHQEPCQRTCTENCQPEPTLVGQSFIGLVQHEDGQEGQRACTESASQTEGCPMPKVILEHETPRVGTHCRSEPEEHRDNPVTVDASRSTATSPEEVSDETAESLTLTSSPETQLLWVLLDETTSQVNTP